jgi:hypothetical protein
MSGRRLLLLLAAAAYLGWLGWLAVAVYDGRSAPTPVVSRAQLTAATHLLVADVEVGPEGYPAGAVKVTKVLRGEGLTPGAQVEVLGLGSALPPGAEKFPGAGAYLIPAVGDGRSFRVAGMPRSPGYEPLPLARPTIYRWDADTEAQLRGLGLIP